MPEVEIRSVSNIECPRGNHGHPLVCLFLTCERKESTLEKDLLQSTTMHRYEKLRWVAMCWRNVSLRYWFSQDPLWVYYSQTSFRSAVPCTSCSRARWTTSSSNVGKSWKPAHEPFALVCVMGCCNVSVVLSGRGGTTVNGKYTRKRE